MGWCAAQAGIHKHLKCSVEAHSFLSLPWIYSNYLIFSGPWALAGIEQLLLTNRLLLCFSSQIWLKASPCWKANRQSFPCQEGSHLPLQPMQCHPLAEGDKATLETSPVCFPPGSFWLHLTLEQKAQDSHVSSSIPAVFSPALSSYLSWLARVPSCVTWVSLCCLCADNTSPGQEPFHHTHLNLSQPLLLLHCSDDCNFFFFFFGKTFVLFYSKEWILTCWQDTGAA